MKVGDIVSTAEAETLPTGSVLKALSIDEDSSWYGKPEAEEILATELIVTGGFFPFTSKDDIMGSTSPFYFQGTVEILSIRTKFIGE